LSLIPRVRKQMRWIMGILAAVAIGTPAGATVIFSTWTGTVMEGFDYTGVFAAVGTDLTGYKYSLVMSFDTDLGVYASGTGFDRLYGGDVYGNTTSPGSAVLTINGIEVDIPTDIANTVVGNSEDFASDDGALSVSYKTVQHIKEIADGRAWGDTVNFHSNINPSGRYPSSILDPFVHTGNICPLGSCISEFQILDYSVVDHVLTTHAEGNFSPTCYSVALGTPSGCAVPEPNAWALAVVGFGLAGAALRTPRRGRAARKV
jgi:hypothetical protein